MEREFAAEEFSDGVRGFIAPQFAADLSTREVIRAGGWHPAYARVLRIEPFDDVALVVVDTNGDGAALEQEAWIRSPEG